MIAGQRFRARLSAMLVISLAALAFIESASAEERTIRSATSFLSPALRTEQSDETANPGMLWISEGEALWQKPDGKNGKSCAACHGDAQTSMKGVAARYPAVDPNDGQASEYGVAHQ